jgi:hypothetical protein
LRTKTFCKRNFPLRKRNFRFAIRLTARVPVLDPAIDRWIDRASKAGVHGMITERVTSRPGLTAAVESPDFGRRLSWMTTRKKERRGERIRLRAQFPVPVQNADQFPAAPN